MILFNLCGHGHFDLAPTSATSPARSRTTSTRPRRWRPRSSACRRSRNRKRAASGGSETARKPATCPSGRLVVTRTNPADHAGIEHVQTSSIRRNFVNRSSTAAGDALRPSEVAEMPRLACWSCGRLIYTVSPLESLFAEERRCPRCGAFLNGERRAEERRTHDAPREPAGRSGPPPKKKERRTGERRTQRRRKPTEGSG